MSISNGSHPEHLSGTGTAVFPERGGATAGHGETWTGKASTYYNHPLIKKADWKWQIILYFFLGGIACGSYLIATLAHLFGLDKQDKNVVRTGRYLSFVCILISPILLIWDLGRPERFLHMLRILKLRSVMSIGTWAISFFGMFCGFSAANQMAHDGLLNWFPFAARVAKALPAKTIGIIGSVFGLVVGSYTGVLLSSTAVPIWARAKHLLGPLFLTSAISTGLSAISLLLSFGRPHRDTLERLDRAEIIAMSTEAVLLASLIPTLGPLGKPLVKGRTGGTFIGGTVISGLLLPLLVKLGFKLSGKASPRTANILVSALVLLGGLILRYEWIAVGRVSADDPQAVHYYNKIEWEESHP
jgi:formate-dependent nitrite reductase membrane component NrfD